jgi:hypothetical protein
VTPVTFFKVACDWAYQHQTTHIEDSVFLPSVQGALSEAEIVKIKKRLAGEGRIHNYRSLSGLMVDFRIEKWAFLAYMKTVIPKPTLEGAKRLFNERKPSSAGQFQSAVFVSELGISEFTAECILDIFETVRGW